MKGPRQACDMPVLVGAYFSSIKNWFYVSFEKRHVLSLRAARAELSGRSA